MVIVRMVLLLFLEYHQIIKLILLNLKLLGIFHSWLSQSTNYVHFPVRKYTEEENRSIVFLLFEKVMTEKNTSL